MAEFASCVWPGCGQLAEMQCSCVPLTFCHTHLASHLITHSGGMLVRPIAMPLTENEAKKLLELSESVTIAEDQDLATKFSTQLTPVATALQQEAATSLRRKTAFLGQVKHRLSQMMLNRAVPLDSTLGALLAHWKSTDEYTDSMLRSDLSQLVNSEETVLPLLELGTLLDSATLILDLLGKIEDDDAQLQRLREGLTTNAQDTLRKVSKLVPLAQKAGRCALRLLGEGDTGSLLDGKRFGGSKLSSTGVNLKGVDPKRGTDERLKVQISQLLSKQASLGLPLPDLQAAPRLDGTAIVSVERVFQGNQTVSKLQVGSRVIATANAPAQGIASESLPIGNQGWQCSPCTFWNRPESMRCELCMAIRPNSSLCGGLQSPN